MRYTILFYPPDDDDDLVDYDAPPWTVEVDTLDEAVDAMRMGPDGTTGAALLRTTGELIIECTLTRRIDGRDLRQ